MDRRLFIKSGFAALLASRFLSKAWAASQTPRAKACIILWMNGGPSHLDTFDLKPGGKFRALSTRAPAIQICEHLPQLADVADHLAIIRSMTSREGNHDRARFLMHAGYSPNPTVKHPSLGAWMSEELGAAKNDLPAFVSISGPSAQAGFLGAQHDPFVVPNPKEPPQNTAFGRNVDADRFARRRRALAMLEARFAAETGDAKVHGRQAVYDKAVKMMFSPSLSAFDIRSEPAAVQVAYGDSDFGRGCLLARKLVEAGVRFVEVTLDGWDTHVDNFGRTKNLMTTLDPAFAALITELKARDLLDSTLIACMGDFGRTPKINPNDGRDHHPQAFSAVLAGGGIRGGLSYGATDGEGEKVREKPVRVADLFATLVQQLGLDPDKSFDTPLGRPISLTDHGRPLEALLGG